MERALEGGRSDADWNVGAGVRKPCFWEPKARNLGISRPLNT